MRKSAEVSTSELMTPARPRVLLTVQGCHLAGLNQEKLLPPKAGTHLKHYLEFEGMHTFCGLSVMNVMKTQ